MLQKSTQNIMGGTSYKWISTEENTRQKFITPAKHQKQKLNNYAPIKQYQTLEKHILEARVRGQKGKR